MITYLIYIVVAVILLFVASLAGKAISRGIEAKNNLNRKVNFERKEDIVKKIDKLKTLYNRGDLTAKEFKKAKEKILDL